MGLRLCLKDNFMMDFAINTIYVQVKTLIPKRSNIVGIQTE